MNNLEEINNFSQIFKGSMPLLDIRAPIEFAEGSFPSALNQPLMTNEERHQIGICYKVKGHESAIKLGHELVKGSLKEQRIGNWLDFVNKHPNGALYCFRGGLRSKIAQEWIYEQSGISFPRIQGGYKALRSFLIDEMSRITNEKKFLVLGGQTGCGKTLLLNELDNSIDLEGFANHRGSAFGNDVTPQPRQIDFENKLTIELIKKEIYNVFLIEDEGNNIGMIHMPDVIKNKARQSDIIILNASLEERLNISLKSYVIDMAQKFSELHGDFGFEQYSNYWLNSLAKIQKRLGGDRYNILLKQLNLALINHQKNEDLSDYLPLIESLLVDYYDPMYNYQIDQKKQRIVFRGNYKEVTSYLKEG